MGFNCTKCGMCCTKVGLIMQTKEQSQFKDVINGFPYKYDSDGVCEKYDKLTKMCMVYDDRPMMCRVDEMQKISGIDPVTYYALTEAVCKQLQK